MPLIRFSIKWYEEIVGNSIRMRDLIDVVGCSSCFTMF